jgi:hypothetical protein
MKRPGLDLPRQRNFPGRYTVLVALSVAAGLSGMAQPSAASALSSIAQPSIWSSSSLTPLYKKADPRPQRLNLVLGRVEQAKVTPQAELPKAQPPTPAPAPGKGPKGGGKAGEALAGFLSSLLELVPPPPPHLTSANSQYCGNMSIGGLKKPEPS